MFFNSLVAERSKYLQFSCVNDGCSVVCHAFVVTLANF